MTRLWAIFAALCVCGCESDFPCEGGRWGLAIYDVPHALRSYIVHLEFEQHVVDVPCTQDDGVGLVWCEVEFDDWRVVVELQVRPPDEFSSPEISVVVYDDHGPTLRIPQGQIMVRITSPQLPGQYIEHLSDPESDMMYDDCETAVEMWIMPSEWTVL